MRAIFIAVGSEMLERDFIDTNSIYVQEKLLERGILSDMKIVIRDDLENLSWTVKNAYKRAQLLIITGGLGPTQDDLTREAVATALKREMVFKEELVTAIQERFRKRKIKMPDINKRQAFIINGADVIPNELGTAPGQYIEDEECKVLLLPGPPSEMKAMFDRVLEEKITPLCNFQIYKRSFKFGGISESVLDAEISDIYARHKNPRTTILASPGVIEVHLLGRSRKSIDETKELTDDIAEKIKEKLKDYLLTEEDISIEELVVQRLREKNKTLSVAESCTGGGLGNRISNVPGCSDIFLGGVIAYSNEVKMNLLAVGEETLRKYGAVSTHTAREMSHGIRNLTGSDIGVSITGIAGPGGAAPRKPVGLVFMHVSTGDKEIGEYRVFPGPREAVKTRTINHCLNLINKLLK